MIQGAGTFKDTQLQSINSRALACMCPFCIQEGDVIGLRNPHGNASLGECSMSLHVCACMCKIIGTRPRSESLGPLSPVRFPSKWGMIVIWCESRHFVSLVLLCCCMKRSKVKHLLSNIWCNSLAFEFIRANRESKHDGVWDLWVRPWILWAQNHKSECWKPELSYSA